VSPIDAFVAKVDETLEANDAVISEVNPDAREMARQMIAQHDLEKKV
jgi:hypothetical protein